MYSFRKVNNHIQLDLISKGSKITTKMKLIQDNVVEIKNNKINYGGIKCINLK